jgi:hypothetical protein
MTLFCRNQRDGNFARALALAIALPLAGAGCVGATFHGPSPGGGSDDPGAGDGTNGSGNGAPGGSGNGTGNGTGNGSGNGMTGAGNGGTPMPPAGPKPMPSATGGFACDGRKPSTLPRLRRLTATQWSNTVAALGLQPAANGRVNPFDDGLASGHFSTDVGQVGLPVESLSLLLDAAESLAADLAPIVKGQTACLAAGNATRPCIDGVLATVGTKAFRRPLTSEESGRFAQFFLNEQGAGGEGTDGALRLMLAALLSSPNFAFRFERGTGANDGGRVKLGPYEVASAISYTVTDGPPDAMLMAAAQGNQLGTTDQIKAHVVRLLGADGKNPAVGRFMREYFRYPSAAAVAKDAKLFPFHKGPLLVEDTDLFMQRVVSQRKPFLELLLAAPGGVARAETAASYGLSNAAAAPAPVDFPAGQRAGIMTQPAFLVAFSGTDNTLPVHRGRYLSENLLCSPVPDIPLTEIPPLPMLPNATAREKLAVHSTMPQCAACHAKMDFFGLALEQYDHTGRFRTVGEGGKTIDASGTLAGAGSEDGPFTGAVQLAGKLSRSPVVRQCFVLQAFRFWTGRDEVSTDGCALRAADEAFTASGGDVVELFTSLLTSDAFLYRTAQ